MAQAESWPLDCFAHHNVEHTDIVIDVVRGRGGMLSLDNGRERRFLVRSDMCALPATTD